MQVISKHFRSLCLIGYLLAMGAIRIMANQGNFKKAHALIAIILSATFLVSLISGLFCKKRVYDGEPFVRIVWFIWDLGWLLLSITVGLKFDGIIDWSWKKVFFPTWIIFALLITASLAVGCITLTSLVPLLLCRRRHLGRLVAMLLMTAHLVAVTVFLPLLADRLAQVVDADSLDSRDRVEPEFIVVIIVITCYTGVIMLVTLACLRMLMYVSCNIQADTAKNVEGFRRRRYRDIWW